MKAIRLRDQGGRGCGLVLPVRRQRLDGLVVATQTVNTRLDQNETELGVLVLPVLLHVLADVDRLLDQVVQILGQLGCQT